MILDWLGEYWRYGIEILILAFGIYQVYRSFRSTRGARILVGLVIILLVLTALLQLFKLQVITWIVTRLMLVLVIALPVIFQPEIRSALARLGSSRWLDWLMRNDRRQLDFLDAFDEAVLKLSKKRIGALFAFERNVSLKPQQDTGVSLNAEFSPELAAAIFNTKSPLHDGAVIIADGRMRSAACILPVSQKEIRNLAVGLRHRAALGLSEESDAICVVVSEETGGISFCMDGQLERIANEENLRKRLAEIFLSKSTESDDSSNKEELGSKDDLADSGGRDLDPD